MKIYETEQQEDILLFGKIPLRELLTECVFSHMQEHEKRMIIFPDNRQLLLTKESDDYNRMHGLENHTERILFRYVKDKGYVITHSDTIQTVTIPEDMLDESYMEFMEKCMKQKSE